MNFKKFTQILNNPRAREIVEQIEETSDNKHDKYMKRFNTSLKKLLKDDYGYEYK